METVVSAHFNVEYTWCVCGVVSKSFPSNPATLRHLMKYAITKCVIPTNITRLSQIEMTWKRSFPCCLNVECTWCVCRDNSKVCECEKIDRLEGLNSYYKWKKAVVLDNNVNYVLEKEADHPCSSFVVNPNLTGGRGDTFTFPCWFFLNNSETVKVVTLTFCSI